MTRIIHHTASVARWHYHRKIVPWGFEKGTLLTFVRLYGCISAPCGVSLSIVELPRIPYHYLIASDARHWPRRHADSTSSAFHPHFERMRLRLSVQYPQPVFLTFFLTEDDANVHGCNLAPVPAFLQRKRLHSRGKRVSRRPHNVDASLIRVQIFLSLH